MPALNLNSPFIRRIFAQSQGADNSVYRTVLNTAGTWSPTGVQFIRAGANSIKLTPNMPKANVNWLTGTRSQQAAILLRKGASWSFNDVDVIPSGVAGTPPDLDILFQNIFGQAPAIVAVTSATYSFLDSGYLPMTLFSFAHGVSTLTQQCLWGAFVNEARFVFNQDFFRCSFSGNAGYLLDSDNFSAEPAAAKAGLTVFPAEPGSVTYAGSSMPGFGATVVIDGQSVETKMLSAEVTIHTGFRVVNDSIADGYGVSAVGGQRAVSIVMSFRDDDSAQLIDLKQKAKLNATMTAILTMGTVAGAKVQMALNALQLVPHEAVDETDQVRVNFPQSFAHATAIGQTNDCQLAFL